MRLLLMVSEIKCYNALFRLVEHFYGHSVTITENIFRQYQLCFLTVCFDVTIDHKSIIAK
jgi:hypothetical protein